MPRNNVAYPFLRAHDDAVYAGVWVSLLSQGRDVAVCQDCRIKSIDTLPRCSSSMSPVQSSEVQPECCTPRIDGRTYARRTQLRIR